VASLNSAERYAKQLAERNRKLEQTAAGDTASSALHRAEERRREREEKYPHPLPGASEATGGDVSPGRVFVHPLAQMHTVRASAGES